MYLILVRKFNVEGFRARAIMVNLQSIKAYLRDHIKKSWLPFIVAFQALLLSCTFAQIFNNLMLASIISAYAYLLLVIGVSLLLLSLIICGDHDVKAND